MITIDRPANELTMSDSLRSEMGTFRIKESARAFRILSTSLYSNPIAAIIRELSCNARDSHVDAGNTDPFVVHFPTALNSVFSVQDFGTGLDHDQVMKLYTTFFESTKTDSNEFVGALGLGSKSPFSYTDNFTVIAIKNGTKNAYSAFINDVGVPAITRGISMTTTEPNGVKVEFAVNTKDINKFVSEGINVLSWFDSMPKTNIHIDKHKLRPLTITFKSSVITFDQTEVFISDRTYCAMHCGIVMGGVFYPIAVEHAAFAKYKELFASGVIIKLPIGAVEPTPSREALTYTANTVAAIVSVLEVVYNKVFDTIVYTVQDIVGDYDKAATLSMIGANNLWSNVTPFIKSIVPDIRTKLNLDNVVAVIDVSALETKKVTVRRFTHTYSGTLKSSGVLNANTSFNTRQSSMFHLAEFFWDDCGIKMSDIIGRPFKRALVLFSGTGIKNASVREKIEREVLGGSKLCPISSIFKVEPREKSAKTVCYLVKNTSVYRSWRYVDEVTCVPQFSVPSGAKYYVDVANGDIDRCTNDAIDGVGVSDQLTHIMSIDKTAVVIGLTKASKVDKTGLIKISTAFRNLGDIDLAAYASNSQMFDSLVAVATTAISGGYLLSNIRQRFQNTTDKKHTSQLKDPVLCNIIKEHKKYDTLIEKFPSVASNVTRNGKTPKECARDIIKYIDIYEIINFGHSDVGAVVRMANLVYDQHVKDMAQAAVCSAAHMEAEIC